MNTHNTNLAVYMKSRRLKTVAEYLDRYIRLCPHVSVIPLWPKDVQAIQNAIDKATDGKLSVFDCEYKGKKVQRHKEVA